MQSLFPYVSDWAAVSIFADLMISLNALNVVMHVKSDQYLFSFAIILFLRLCITCNKSSIGSNINHSAK